MDSPRDMIAAALRRDAALHEGGQVDTIGNGYDAAEGEILPLESTRERDIGVALSFWDGWIDARNHAWRHYEGIARSDWPILARTIAAALEARHPITDAVVLGHFAPESQRSLWSRVRGWLDRRHAR